MAKPMSLVWLIAIGLLTVTYVMGKSPAFEQTTDDDTGKGSLEGREREWKGEDDVVKGDLKETSGSGMAELQDWKDKVDVIRKVVDIIAEGHELYSRMSAHYEKVQKGEISQEEFDRDVARRLCLVVGKAAGKNVGNLMIPWVGKAIGRYVGEELGKVCGFWLTGEAADGVAMGLIPQEGGDFGNALRHFGQFLGNLGWALDVVINFCPRLSATYKRWNNGEISIREFQWEVGKDVVRVGSPVAGTVVGATLGAWYLGPALGQLAIPIPGLGAAVGAYVGNSLGGMVEDFLTG